MVSRQFENVLVEQNQFQALKRLNSKAYVPASFPYIFLARSPVYTSPRAAVIAPTIFGATTRSSEVVAGERFNAFDIVSTRLYTP